MQALLNSHNSVSGGAPVDSALKVSQESGGFLVELSFFTGPMDLLLHLVRQQEVPIEQVQMRIVTEQYLDIISRASFLDLELASEYLVIAATLVDLKSQSILPSPTLLDESEELEGRDPAFLEELRERLRQYELTKKRAEELRALPQLGRETFVRCDRKVLLPDPETIGDEPGDAQDLGKMFFHLLKRIGESGRRFFVRMDSVSVVSFMMKILKFMDPVSEAVRENGKPAKFFDIFRALAKSEGLSTNSGQAAQKTRHVLVGTFISTLELVKRGLLQVSGSTENGNFQISLAMAGDSSTKVDVLDSEFDQPGEIHVATTPRTDVIDMHEYKANRQKHEDDGAEHERREVNRNA